MTFSVYSLIQMSIGKQDFFELQADLTQHFIYVFILTILFTVGYLFIFPYSLRFKKNLPSILATVIMFKYRQ